MSYEKVTQVQSRIVIGTKQTLKAMKNGEAGEVIIAEDADPQLTKEVAVMAEELDIPCQHVDSKRKLGAACGIDVGASVVAIKRL